MADSKVKDVCINTLCWIAFLAFVFALGYGWTHP